MKRLGEIWARPIPAEQSLAAFAAVAVTLLVAAAVLIAIPGGDPGEPVAEPVVAGSIRSAPGRDRQLERTIERAAREFMVGYLAFVSGQGGPRQVTHATPELKGRMSRPERVPPAARHRTQHVIGTESHLVAADRASVTVTVEAGRISYPVIVQLAPRTGRWLVEKVGVE